MKNDDKFNELYEKYHRLVGSIALKYLRDENSVEDAIQETFILVFKKIGLFEDTTEVHERNLICQIAKFVAIGMYRKSKNRESNVDIDYESILLGLESNENVEEYVINNTIFMEAMSCLSEREKEMITLKFFKGYSNNEIAEIFHIKKAWTSELISGALKKMRKYIEGNNKD